MIRNKRPYAPFLTEAGALPAWHTLLRYSSLSHKLREAMVTEDNGNKIGGVGKTVEIEGFHFVAYQKPLSRPQARV